MFVPFCWSYGMWDPWETHYGEAARQILVRGDWWTLYWEDNFFFSKPILLFWLMATSFGLFGVNEFAARLPVVLCAVAGIYSVYWGVTAVVGRRFAGVMAAAAVATAPLYAFISRQCITDMPFVASMTIAMMALARYAFAPGGRPRHMYMVYFFCGLATLAKGPLGLLLPGAVVLTYLVISGNWALLKRARIPTGALVFLAVAAPWYLTMLLVHGERFLNEFFIYNNVQRATGTGVHGAHPDPLYYLRRANPQQPLSGAPVLQVGTFPWLSLFPAALLTALIRRVRLVVERWLGEERPSPLAWLELALVLFCCAELALVILDFVISIPDHLFLWVGPLVVIVATAALTRMRGSVKGGGEVDGRGDPAAERRQQLNLLLVSWVVIAFLVFSLIPTKFHHYLLPLAPPVAIAAMLWLLDAARGRLNQLVVVVGLLVAAGITAWTAQLLGQRPWELLDLFMYQYGRADIQRFAVGSIYHFGGLAIAAVFIAAAVVRRLRLASAAALVVAAGALTIYGIDVYLPRASDCVSQADAFEHYEAERRPGDQLVNWHMNYRGEVFYGRSQAVKAVSDTHLRWLLSRSDRTFIVANRSGFGSLARAMRRITGSEPNILNPATCHTRMVLYDGPPVEPPRFVPPPGSRLEQVPASVANQPEDVQIGSDISLVGYQVDWLGAGSSLTADITVYLRCERDTDQWWKLFIHGESDELPGRRAISDHTAVGDAYPSVAWRPGEILVDHTRLRVGWILDAIGGEGEITINLGLFHDETRARVTPESAHDGQDRVVVARFDTAEVPEDGVLTELPDGVEPAMRPVRFGDMATLVAWEVSQQGRGRRRLAEVTLYLRAEERTERPWQIFLHAEGEAGRRDRAVSDHHPLSGRLPTTRWEPGQIVVDRTVLDLGRVSPGEVWVYVGLFSDRGRAPVSPAEAGDDSRRVLLEELEPGLRR